MSEALLNTPQLRREDFQRIQRIAHSRFGLWLRDGKEELVRTRLGKELRRLGTGSFREYADLLESDNSGELEEQFTNLLTTNHTHFFRETEHFTYLESTVLPQIHSRPAITIWCAACATGEEAYTLAICLLRYFAGIGRRGGNPAGTPLVEATDISTKALATAAAAVYEEARFHGLDPGTLREYLLRGGGPKAGSYRLRPEVRAQVRFRPINLLRDWPFRETFPAIFCRNVMIYFDRETQEGLVRRMAGQLEPGGYLFVGHSESLNGMDHGLEYVRPAVYRKHGSLAGGRGAAAGFSNRPRTDVERQGAARAKEGSGPWRSMS